ncbi:MAG: hypothetical protein H6838_07355 [Planctomycetes bacterium]|nr:hypothetical protein [Planctomycetota bacterium]
MNAAPAIAPRPARLRFLPALLLALAAPLAAQTCEVRASYRIATGVNNSPSTNVHFDSGWQQVAPLHTAHTSTNSNNLGCNTYGTVAATADFGWLSCRGNAVGNNSQGNGVFLWIDEYIGGEPKARYRDNVTITSPTLPNGTPVQLQLSVDLAGFAFVQDPNPLVTYAAEILVWGSGWPVARVQDQVGSASMVVATTVGTTLTIEGKLFATLDARAIQGGTPMTSSISFDLRARTGIAVLTPGADYTTCSGRRQDPQGATVQNLGGGCGAASPLLTATVPQLGQTIPLTLSGAPANVLVVLGASFGAPVATQIGSCQSLLNLPAAIMVPSGATNGAGSWTTPLGLPSAPAFLGLELVTQTLLLQAGGPLLGVATLSNALDFRLGT